MARLLLFSSLLCLLAIASHCFASSDASADVFISPFGVDSPSSGGTKSSPYRTLSYAVSNVAPAGTIHVMVGTYTGSSNIAVSFGGISVQGYPEDEPADQFLFDAQDHSSSRWTILGDQVNSTNITRIHFRNFGSSGAISYSPSSIYESERVSDLGVNGCVFESSGTSIRVTAGSSSKSTLWVNGSSFHSTNALKLSTPQITTQTTVEWEVTYNEFNASGISIAQTGAVDVSLDAAFNSFEGDDALLTITPMTYFSRNPSFTSTLRWIDFKHASNAVVVSTSASNAYTAGVLVRVFDSYFYNLTDGAIHLDAPGSIIVISSSSFNKCGGQGVNGGAIAVDGHASINVKDSTFTSNDGNDGGALYCGETGTLNVQNSKFSFNSGVDEGVAYCSPGCSVIAAGISQSYNSATNQSAPCSGF